MTLGRLKASSMRWVLLGAALCAALLIWRVGRGVMAVAGSPARASLSSREIRFDGLVEEITDGQWRVAGYALEVPASVRRAANGIRVGDQVLVHARRTVGGVMIATSIQSLPQRVWAGGDVTLLGELGVSDVEVEGTIRGLPAGTALGTWQVDDVAVLVGKNTTISGVPAVGALVEVTGTSSRARQLDARTVRVEDSEQGSLLLQGVISAQGAGVKSVWTLEVADGKGGASPVRVLIDDRTFIDESRGIADVQSRAEVRAVAQPDGTLWAQYIRIEYP